MKTAQYEFSNDGWKNLKGSDSINPQLFLVNGDRELLEDSAYIKHNGLFENADWLINSTSGEILEGELREAGIYATAIEFEKSQVETEEFVLDNYSNAQELGRDLGKSFSEKKPGLRLIYVMSDGHNINGSNLVKGIVDQVDSSVVVTGGLAGDGTLFSKTLVGLNEITDAGRVVAFGVYGDDLIVGSGSNGGWMEFGGEKRITKSEGNVLYELDNESALGTYKKYLGDKASELPASALLFPLCLKEEGQGPIVRTILSVDEEKGSMTFAGNLPEDAKVRMMKANMNDLISAAAKAAEEVKKECPNPELLLLVSCVGRRAVLGQMTEDEIDEVRLVFNSEPSIMGYYSYGEICRGQTEMCQLHNQTMTITGISEQ